MKRIVFYAWFLAFASNARAEGIDILNQAIVKLCSGDTISSAKAQIELINARQSVIAALIDFIRNKENLKNKYGEGVCKCMKVLGNYRATEAKEVLIDYIAYPLSPVLAHVDLGTNFGVPERYPAANALAEIGEAVIPALLKRIRAAEPISGLLHKLTVKVIVDLRGKEGAHEILKNAMVNAKGIPKSNFKIALQEWESLVRE